MYTFSPKAFTLMEMMLAIAAISILVSALLPSYTAYQMRWRDVSRVSHMNSLWKIINNYFIDKEDYPNHAAGCVDATALNQYGPTPTDPLGIWRNDNGCGTNGNYAYGSSALLLSSKDEFALFAKMEWQNAWNFNTGSVAWLTGVLDQAAFTTLSSGMQRGTGQYYAIIR